MRILIRVLVVCFALAVVIGTAVLWRPFDRGPDRGRSEVLSVRVWRFPGMLGWDCTDVDLRNARIRVVGTSFSESPIGCRSVEAALSQSEVHELADMIRRADLESFTPKGEWFAPVEGYDEGSGYLEIRYGTGEVVFADPPPDLERDLPDYAARRYESIFALWSQIGRLHKRCVGKGTDSKPVGTIEEEKLLKQSDHFHESSLPRGRKGW